MNGRRTILLAGNDPDYALLFLFAFEHEHCPHHLRWVQDSEHALAYLKGQGDYADRSRYPAPDLVVLDLKMQGEDNVNVLRWLQRHEHESHSLAVVVGKKPNGEEKARATRLGASDYYAKCSDFDDMQKTLREMLGKLPADSPKI